MKEATRSILKRPMRKDGVRHFRPLLFIKGRMDRTNRPAALRSVLRRERLDLVRSFRQHRLTIIRENSFPRSFSDCYRIQDLTGEIMEVRQVAFT